MNIAIFGGAFDPPHLGHKFVADSLIEKKIVDEVWFVPVFKHPWANRYNKKQLAPYDSRVAMIGMFISDHQKIAHFKDVSFTYDTLIYFQKKFPQHTFSWVMGTEYLGRFDDFLAGHPKLLDFHFYIYPRAGYPFEEKLLKKNMTFLVNMKEIRASSTDIKAKLNDGTNIENLVSAGVNQYIKANKLYI